MIKAAPNRYRLSRGQLKQLIIVFALLGVLIPSAWLNYHNRQIQLHRNHLLLMPDPVPIWILAIAPAPGNTISIDKAYFGVSRSDPFFPGLGTICVQLDKAASGMATASEADSKVILSLNGNDISQVNVEVMARMPSFVPTFVLVYGLQVVRGIIHTNNAENSSAVNMCWEMNLYPDEYLARLRVNQKSGFSLDYEWAFRLGEK